MDDLCERVLPEVSKIACIAQGEGQCAAWRTEGPWSLHHLPTSCSHTSSLTTSSPREGYRDAILPFASLVAEGPRAACWNAGHSQIHRPHKNLHRHIGSSPSQSSLMQKRATLPMTTRVALVPTKPSTDLAPLACDGPETRRRSRVSCDLPKETTFPLSPSVTPSPPTAFLSARRLSLLPTSITLIVCALSLLTVSPPTPLPLPLVLPQQTSPGHGLRLDEGGPPSASTVGRTSSLLRPTRRGCTCVPARPWSARLVRSLRRDATPRADWQAL